MKMVAGWIIKSCGLLMLFIGEGEWFFAEQELWKYPKRPRFVKVAEASRFVKVAEASSLREGIRSVFASWKYPKRLRFVKVAEASRFVKVAEASRFVKIAEASRFENYITTLSYAISLLKFNPKISFRRNYSKIPILKYSNRFFRKLLLIQGGVSQKFFCYMVIKK